jgi:flagellar motor switch protein FliN/FliY
MTDNEIPAEDPENSGDSEMELADLTPDAAADQAQKSEAEAEGGNIVSSKMGKDLEAVYDIPVNVSAILGRTYMDVSELLNLEEGNVLELDRKVGEAIDIFVNNRLIARGEVVLVEDRLGITMTEIVKGETH